MSNNLETFFQDLQNRGTIANYANLDNFYQLTADQKIIYLGIDCTGESLHIGHLFLLIQTIRFAKEGFQVLLVLGGATSKIGDPSDKSKERTKLEGEKLIEYQQKIKAQLHNILIEPREPSQMAKTTLMPLEQFYSDNPELLSNIYQVLGIKQTDSKEKQWAKYLSYIWPLTENKYQILNNQDWLEKLSFVDFIDQVGRNISINYLLVKDWVKQRLESGLSYLAFSYSLLQAYDFYYLYKTYNCHGQLGGSDQWGNLTTGLKLLRGFYPQNQTFAFNFPLLVDKDGKKFSKSESGKKLLWLNSKKQDFYDFFRNMPDEQAKIYIKQFSFLNENQIQALMVLNNPPKLRILQRILYELVSWLNNYEEVTKL